MKYIHAQQIPEELLVGISELSKELNIMTSTKGTPTVITKGETNRLSYDGKRISISYRDKNCFFRLLGRVLELKAKTPITIEEHRQFDRCGVMFDCSRNAVLSPDGFRFMLRRMALMGLNIGMVYTEDTYEIEKYPWFGYLRGKYSQKELKELDTYADQFGIELVPCIQTLGHLEKVLRWKFAQLYKDTSWVLLADDEPTLDFIRDMIKAAAAPYRSKRIHVGMDETYGIGSGQYLEKNGYVPGKTVLAHHIHRVNELCKELGLEAMIWSDMVLRSVTHSGEYVELKEEVKDMLPIPQNLIPSDIGLVYWDYYHDHQADYDLMLRKHKQFPNPIIFAGGGWNWNGIVPNYGKAFVTTNAALSACKENQIQEVICTAWGDDGGETSFYTLLPTMQLFAEHCFDESVPTQTKLKNRFKICCNGNIENFLEIRYLDEIFGIEENNLQCANPAKLLLYQDPLGGLFDKHIPAFPIEKHYQKMTRTFFDSEAKSHYRALFRFYGALARVLAKKANLGNEIRAAYLANRRLRLKKIREIEIPELISNVNELKTQWYLLWNELNRMSGFEVIDIRLGGVRARLETTMVVLGDWLTGKIKKIEILEEGRLYYDGQTSDAGPHWLSENLWQSIVSANPPTQIP